MPYKVPFCVCGAMLVPRVIKVFSMEQEWPRDDAAWTCFQEGCEKKGSNVDPLWKEVQVVEAAKDKPRLELTWQKVNENGDWYAAYELVVPVKDGDIRNDGTGHFRAKMGGTKVNTTAKNFPLDENGQVETPFRDGVHLMWDAGLLGVEAWAIYKDVKTKITKRIS
jgi:hypothetical protein